MKLPSPTTIERRLAKIGPLQKGAHLDHKAMCIMEAVAFVAGEPWSDAPQCASPVISTFLRDWNDSLNDERRDALLRRFIPKLIGTRGSDALENRRATMAADWLIRVHTPAWLKLAGLTTHAEVLASLPEIVDFAQCPSLMPALSAARHDATAARDAARDAAGRAARATVKAAAWSAAIGAAGAVSDAVSDAAGTAARDAAVNAALAPARAAARDAARTVAGAAAWAAARDAAWSAAIDAAVNAARGAAWDIAVNAVRDAARSIARDALKSTVSDLQYSAIELVERMIDTQVLA